MRRFLRDAGGEPKARIWNDAASRPVFCTIPSARHRGDEHMPSFSMAKDVLVAHQEIR
jgi:hypothetical protein